jgi:hypothetical protein
MKGKCLLVIVLVIQALSVFQVNGQELREDTISVPRSMQDKGDLQLQPIQSTPQLAMPELWNNDESLHGISVDRKIENFNFNRELKYLNIPSGDSSSLFLPVYPGLGDYQNFGGTLGNFNFTNKLSLEYGAFISGQYGYPFSTKQIVFGSNFQLQYAITNRLHFQTWGQYVTPGNSFDPIFNMHTFFPTTNFGAGLQYDSNEKTKIKVGIEYQYDESDKSWKPESGGKVLLKF